MPDQEFAGALAAFGVQTAFGSQNATVAALSGALDSDDGIVLGDRDAGDAASGITLPDFVRQELENQQVAASLTEQAGDYLRTDVDGFGIDWRLRGNGALASASPTPGEAAPVAGIDALFQMVGLIGANGGSNVEYDYTPRHSGSSGGSTIYGTSKLWSADLSWVVQDLICESLELAVTGAGILAARPRFATGVHDPSSDFADGVTFPTPDWGAQLTTPAIIGKAAATSSWGTVRGFQNFSVTIENALSQVEDILAATGFRQLQDSRVFRASGVIYVDANDSDYEFQNLSRNTPPTDDLIIQLGAAATLENDVINAVRIELRNLQLNRFKATRLGTVFAVEFDGKATATTAGGEFLLQFL